MIILIKITINGIEHEDVIELGTRRELSEQEKYELIEKHLTTVEDNTFYYDTTKFIEEKVSMTIEKMERANLYQVDVLEYQGYDTYDSAIICEYTPKRAEEIAMKHLGDYFYGCNVKKVGEASEETKIGVLVSSFNAG